MAHAPKVLFVATVEIHILTFHLPYLQYFNEQGYEVHVACAGDSEIPYCHVKHTIPFARSPYNINNVKSFLKLKALIQENAYALVHGHTPVGGVIGRLAAADARKRYGTKVLYTAHGFQFYKGGPLRDWLLYYPVEKLLARFTDVLITINQEDYQLALRKKFKAGAVEKINGIGLDTQRFQTSVSASNDDINDKVFTLLGVGEINKNKNQAFLLDVVKELNADPEIKTPVRLVLAGPDSLGGSLLKRVETLDVREYVTFLGYRKDIPALLTAADILVSASHREGLGFNVLEAMAAGKPVIATENRGHRELIAHGVNGFLIEQGNGEAFTAAVKKLYNDAELRAAFGQAGVIKSRAFTLESVLARMRDIYGRVLGLKG